MEPEENFLENAATMLKYAEKEMKQFVAWTHTHRSYEQSPDSIIARLENMTAEIMQLKQELNSRRRLRAGIVPAIVIAPVAPADGPVAAAAG